MTELRTFFRIVPALTSVGCRLPVIFSVIALQISGIGSPAVCAEDSIWNRFRGPNGSGISDAVTVPTEFTVADYNWRLDLQGGGHSSPVAWGQHIYLTVENTAEGGAKTRSVVCVHAEDGRKLWQLPQTFEEHNLNKFNNFASSTPACDKDGVYVTWGSGRKSRAIGVSHDGKLLWQRSWDGFSSDHGSAASPIVVDGVLIIHTDSKDLGKSHIRALDPLTGADVWTHERVTAEGEKHLTVYSTPVLMKNGARNIVVLLSPNDGWLALDVKTGEQVWRHKDEYKFRNVGSLALSEDGLLFATMGSGGAGKDSAALRWKSGTDKPELVYSLGIKDGLSYVPTPLFYDGLLFLWGDGGIVTCRDARSGEQIYKERVGGNFFSSPICIDGRIYCGSREGEMVVIPAARDFEITARVQFDAGIYATPAVVDGRLIVRTETHLISIGGKGKR